MSEKKPTPMYIYELADATGKLRYVEARSKEQAIAHVFKTVVKTLSARDAVTLARNPNIEIERAREPKAENQLDLPLAGDTPPAAAGAATEPVSSQEPAQTEPAPPAAPPKKGLFGRPASA